MRVYLDVRQTEPIVDANGDETKSMRIYDVGFHRVDDERGQAWLDARLAVPATESNEAIRPAPPPPDPKPRPEPEPEPEELTWMTTKEEN